MRLSGLLATAFGLLVAACSSPYPQPVAFQPQQHIVSCARGNGLHHGCRTLRFAALSSGGRSARMTVPSWGIGTQSISTSNSVPVINVEQVCQGIASQDVTFQDRGKAWVKKDCLETEQEVQNNLAKQWANFHANDRNHCTTEAKMGGESSYTELLTCLEMAREVRRIHEDAKTHEAKDYEDPDAVRRPHAVGQR
jgi:hypothetical protein